MPVPAPNRAPRAGLAAALALSVGLGAASLEAQAGAVIYNSSDPLLPTVALGVNDQGHLNFASSVTANAPATGISLLFPFGFTGDPARDGTFQDATSPGCLCEGWGLAVTLGSGERISGFASVDNGGVGGLTAGTFSANATATTNATAATSVVGLAGTAATELADAPVTITHSYGVSLAPNTFQGNITIRNNTNSAITDVVYRRAMDWDVPPTEFNEYVTHNGIAANLERFDDDGVNIGGNVRYASDNGFNLVDPLQPANSINPETQNTDFVDNGPNDHGSVFDFAFGTIGAGEQRSFNIFYGAFTSESDALDAVRILSPNVYSLGQPRLSEDDVYIPGDTGGGDCGAECPPPPSCDEGDCPIETLTDVSIAATVELATVGISGPGNSIGAPTFLFAFGGVGGVEQGLGPTTPILPFVLDGNVFHFPAPIPRRWYDPPFTSGFEYAFPDMDGEFTGVMTPDGFGDLMLSFNGIELVLEDGVEYRFGPGVETFRLFALDERFDLGDPTKLRTLLPTFVDFMGAPSGFTMTPLPPRSSVPAPEALALLMLACAGVGLSRRTR